MTVLTDEQAVKVENYARKEVPPSAVNRASVKENCQGWTIRVLEKLAEEGIINAAKLQTVKDQVEPIQ